MNIVVRDLSFDNGTWAIVWRNEILPVRFTKEEDAVRHLHEMKTGQPLPKVGEGSEPC